MICNTDYPIVNCRCILVDRIQVLRSKRSLFFLKESYFNPVAIRKTSKRHSLKTDASFRFERGADPAIVPYALKRAAILLQEITGATIVGEIKEIYPEPIEEREISNNYQRIEEFNGKKIGSKVMVDILTSMDFEFIRKDEFRGRYSGAIISCGCNQRV